LFCADFEVRYLYLVVNVFKKVIIVTKITRTPEVKVF